MVEHRQESPKGLIRVEKRVGRNILHYGVNFYDLSKMAF